MAQCQKHHQELTDGIGKCSVPMWSGGVPAGFCDSPAFGKPTKCREWRNQNSGEMMREDGKYNGYVPGLACPGHGGPEVPEHHMVCTECGALFDMRDLGQVFKHEHSEIVLGTAIALGKKIR